MISLSEIKSASGAATYFNDAFAKPGTTLKAADNYYRDGNSPMTWQGRGAEVMGIAGKEVTSERFCEALAGRMFNPETGKIQELGGNSKGHRAGWDFTISPPKSVSTLALVGEGDSRLVEAHAKATRDAMEWLATNGAQFRMRSEGGAPQHHASGNLIYATTIHTTNRHNEPQLHSHNVVANATWDADRGVWRSLTNSELYRIRTSADGIYKSQLMAFVREAGYEVEIDPKGGFEIVGASKANDAFSTRTVDMEAAIKKWYADRGIDHRDATREMREIAKLAVRPPKDELTLADANKEWTAIAKREGIDFDGIREAARSRLEKGGLERATQDQADQAVAKAFAQSLAGGKPIKTSALEVSAARLARGRATIDQIKAAISVLEADGKLNRSMVDGVEFVAKPGAVDRQLSDAIKAGKDRHHALHRTEDEFLAAVSKYEAQMQQTTGDASWRMTPQALDAARAMTMHQDSVQAIQSEDLLSRKQLVGFVSMAAADRGWRVDGYAASSQAAALMESKLGIKTETFGGAAAARAGSARTIKRDIDQLKRQVSRLQAEVEGNKGRYTRISANVRTLGIGLGKDRYMVDSKTGNVYRASAGLLSLRNWAALKVNELAMRKAGQMRYQVSQMRTEWGKHENPSTGQRLGSWAKLKGRELGGMAVVAAWRGLGKVAGKAVKWQRVGAVEAKVIKEIQRSRNADAMRDAMRELSEKQSQLANLNKYGNTSGKQSIAIIADDAAKTQGLGQFVQSVVSAQSRAVVMADEKTISAAGLNQGNEARRANTVSLDQAKEPERQLHAAVGDYAKRIEAKTTEIQGGVRGLAQEVANRYVEAIKKHKPSDVRVTAIERDDKAAINEAIRDKLRETGEIQGKEHTKEHIADLGLSQIGRGDVGKLREAGVNVMTATKSDRDLKIKAGDELRVVGFDDRNNTLKVIGEDGKIRTVNPEKEKWLKPGVAEERSYAAGDRIQAQAGIGNKYQMEPGKTKGSEVRKLDADGLPIRNKDQVISGERGRIERIDGKGATVRWDSGKTTTLSNEQLKGVDHAYATSERSQARGEKPAREIVAVSDQGAKQFGRHAAQYAQASQAEIVSTNKAEMLRAAGEKNQAKREDQVEQRSKDAKDLGEQRQDKAERQEQAHVGRPNEPISTEKVESADKLQDKSQEKAEAKGQGEDRSRIEKLAQQLNKGGREQERGR